jgi:hypothetical protein
MLKCRRLFSYLIIAILLCTIVVLWLVNLSVILNQYICVIVLRETKHAYLDDLQTECPDLINTIHKSLCYIYIIRPQNPAPLNAHVILH